MASRFDRANDGDETPIDLDLGVCSETAALGCVIVHQPGRELERLTPPHTRFATGGRVWLGGVDDEPPGVTIEGGDVLLPAPGVVLIGMG